MQAQQPNSFMNAHLPFTRRQKKHLLLVVPRHDIFVRMTMLIEESAADEYIIDWAATYRFGISLVKRDACEVCLVATQIGTQSGTEFAREARQFCHNLPMILLSESDDDFQTLEAAERNLLWDRIELEKLSPRLLCDSLRDACHSVAV